MATINPVGQAEVPLAQTSVFRRCLTDRKVVETAKVAFWWASSIASMFIPVPVVSGALAGSTFFLGTSVLIQHYFHLTERHWAQLGAGILISAAGWGAGFKLIEFSLLREATGAFVWGTGCSLFIAYGPAVGM
jgi:hypothetical protein